MTPRELFIEIKKLESICGMVHPPIEDQIIDLIEQAKSEWCRQQREICSWESRGYYELEIKNAPEPK